MKRIIAILLLACILLCGCKESGVSLASTSSSTPPADPPIPLPTRECTIADPNMDSAFCSAWVEWNGDGTFLFYRKASTPLDPFYLQQLGLTTTEARENHIYRYQGTCTSDGSSHTMTVSEITMTITLEAEDPDSLRQALKATCSEGDDRSAALDGAYVRVATRDLEKIVLSVNSSALTALVLWDTAGRIDTYEFYEDGASQAAALTSNGQCLRQLEFHENGQPKEIIQFGEDGRQAMQRQWNEHGHETLCIEYTFGVESTYTETQYTYYPDGTIHQSVSTTIQDRILPMAQHNGWIVQTDYIPNGIMQKQIKSTLQGQELDRIENNEHGHATLLVSYGYDGALYSYSRREYAYYDSGSIQSQRVYQLFADEEVLYSDIDYYENGNRQYDRIYHPNGQLQIYTAYSIEGLSTEHVEYDQDGNEIARD